jgi:hypothetical protein
MHYTEGTYVRCCFVATLREFDITIHHTAEPWRWVIEDMCDITYVFLQPKFKESKIIFVCFLHYRPSEIHVPSVLFLFILPTKFIKGICRLFYQSSTRVTRLKYSEIFYIALQIIDRSGGVLWRSSHHVRPRRFGLLAKPTNLQPRHVTNETEPDYKRSWKWPFLLPTHSWHRRKKYTFTRWSSSVIEHIWNFRLETTVSSARRLRGFLEEWLSPLPVYGISLQWAFWVSIIFVWWLSRGNLFWSILAFLLCGLQHLDIYVLLFQNLFTDVCTWTLFPVCVVSHV